MIDAGKVIVRSKGKSARGPWECTPWELLPYSEHELAHSIESFNNLITRIEYLLEDPSLRPLDNLDDHLRLLEACTAKLNQPVSQELSGLVSQEILDSLGIPEGFIRRFLLQVRRPKNIRYVAPGLRLPTPSDFASYPYQNFQLPDSMEYDNPVLPIPLFISDIKSSTPLLGYPFHEVSHLPHGLWMEYCNRDAHHTFESTCRLYLPFEIGANGICSSY